EVQQELTSSVSLKMPMSEDHSTLRVSMLPEMLASMGYNVARKQANIAYYELGSIFIAEEEAVTKQPDEKLRLAGTLTGEWLSHPWQQEKKAVDFFVVKGIIEGLFELLNLEVTFKQTKMSDMHPGRTAQLFIGERAIGFTGQLHPQLQKEYDIKDTFVFDIDFDYILAIHENE